MSNLTQSGKSNDAELEVLRQTMVERTCRVGGPRGAVGIVEKVFRARGQNTENRAKVLMESGAVRYVNVIDVNCY